MSDKDPSMTEILASIRRIISEDDAEFGAAPAERKPAPAEAPVTTDAADPQETPQETPDPPPAPAAESPPPPPQDASLLSTQVEDEAVRAFAMLRRNVAVPQGESVPLDALVREMLHPLLRHWLDTHLPKLVESLVREEIRRIAQKKDE